MADLEKKKVTELFDLLESDDTEIVAEIKQLIHENLNSTRESWVLNSLFDYYFVTQSKRAMELLAGVQAPHDKHLFDKLNEGLKNSDHKLLTLRLLLFTVFKQPAWIHKLVKSPAFGSVIKCLKNDTDIPTLMTAVLVITMYLPIDAISVTSHLPDIFDIFTRLLAFSKKKPGNIPDIFLLHLQVSVYSLFHRLYGMFPCNFLAYLRYHFSRSENTEVYDDVLKPMIERVRLHPLLITASKDSEVTHKRWRKKENHDILVECARLSLDIIEGTWEEVRCPIAAPRLNVFSRLINERTSTPSVSATSASRLSMGPGYLPPAEPSPHVTPSYWSDTNILWSPSSMCGLSTPPPSHVTSQNASSLDYTCSIQHSFPGTSITNTPLLTTPSQTPRATPPVVVDDLFDRSRNSRSNLSKRLSGNSLSSPKLHVGTSATVQSSFESQASHSVPPSPLRAEFTSEPPAGTHRTYPLPRAAQKLPFDDVPEKLNPEGGMFSYHLANKLDSSLVEKFQSLSQEVISESPMGNDDTAVSHSSLDSDATITENKPRAMSIKVVDKVVQEMKGIHDNADDTDKEVRDIIEDDPSRGFAASESNDRVDSSVQLTAESVQRFMRKVNRIRFNSLTTGNKMEVLTDLGSRVGKWNRSHSCPQLQKEAEEDTEITNQLYRCSSAAPRHDLQPLGSDQPHSANTDQTVPQANTEPIPSNSVPNSGHVKASSSVTDVAPVPEDEDPTSQESNQGQSDTDRTKTVALTQSEIEDNAVIEQILPRPFDRILQYSLPYAAITRCQQCKKRYVTALENKDLHSESLADADYEMPLFSTFSPPELLDRHLHLGGEVHAKELSRIPITSQDSINWTHFGGLPPADEINILRGQILLIQNQLMFERHKRELHAKRNRRMLSKITQAKALEERNSALLDQLRLQENEIQSLQVSLKLLQQENQTLKGDRDSDFNIQQVQLRDCVATTGELQYEVSQLKAQIEGLKGEKSEILKMYQAAKGKLFNTEKDVEALQGQVAIAKELQDEIARLNKELLLMGELHQKYQEQLSFKHNRPSHTEEQEYELVSLRKELKARKHQLEQRQLHTSSMQKKLLEMEEMLKHKDVTLTDVKRSLEMVKASHQEEIKAVENKYQSSVRIGQQLESHVMELYGQIETLRRSNRQRGSVKVPTSGNQGNQSPISSSSRSQSPYKSQSETSVLSTGSHSNQVYTDKTTRSAVAAWSSPPAVVKSAQMTHPVLSSQFSSGSIGLPSSALLSQSDAFSSSGRVLNQPLDRDRASSESPVMVMETRNTSDPVQTDISGRGDLIGSGTSETDQSRDLLELDTDGERTSNSSRSNTLCDSGVETR